MRCHSFSTPPKRSWRCPNASRTGAIVICCARSAFESHESCAVVSQWPPGTRCRWIVGSGASSTWCFANSIIYLTLLLTFGKVKQWVDAKILQHDAVSKAVSCWEIISWQRLYVASPNSLDWLLKSLHCIWQFATFTVPGVNAEWSITYAI